MSESYEVAIQLAMNLPEGERVLLIDTLINSLRSPDAPLHESWYREIQRRSDEFDRAGESIPWEEVKENARRRLKHA